jgi:uracil-DNA glycosylase
MNQSDLLNYLADFGWRDVELATGKRTRVSEAVGQAEDTVLATGGNIQMNVIASVDPLAAPNLDEMKKLLAQCTRCRLSQGRRQVVFGVGNPMAKLMIIGEAPGADEDRQGEPFVGRAGQLLTLMIKALGLQRSDVYIANILKCRPPDNRDPEGEEAACCMPFLRRQIELVNPAVIVLVGRIAARFLLGNTAPISTYRGRWLSWQGRNVIATFHPAYLLRNPIAKAQAWVDLKNVKAKLSEFGQSNTMLLAGDSKLGLESP